MISLQRGIGLIPGQGTKTPHGQKVKINSLSWAKILNIKSLRQAFHKPRSFVPQLRACRAVQTSSQVRPAHTTTPYAHLLPPRDVHRGTRASLQGVPVPTVAEPSHLALPLGQSPQPALGSVSCLPVPSFTSLQVLEKQRHIFTQVLLPLPCTHTQHFITLHTLSFHQHQANSGRREVHDSYNLEFVVKFSLSWAKERVCRENSQCKQGLSGKTFKQRGNYSQRLYFNNIFYGKFIANYKHITENIMSGLGNTDPPLPRKHKPVPYVSWVMVTVSSFTENGQRTL